MHALAVAAFRVEELLGLQSCLIEAQADCGRVLGLAADKAQVLILGGSRPRVPDP